MWIDRANGISEWVEKDGSSWICVAVPKEHRMAWWWYLVGRHKFVR